MKSSKKMQEINNDLDSLRLLIFKDKFPLKAKINF